jgi:hypothetical protein
MKQRYVKIVGLSTILFQQRQKQQENKGNRNMKGEIVGPDIVLGSKLYLSKYLLGYSDVWTTYNL